MTSMLHMCCRPSFLRMMKWHDRQCAHYSWPGCIASELVGLNPMVQGKCSGINPAFPYPSTFKCIPWVFIYISVFGSLLFAFFSGSSCAHYIIMRMLISLQPTQKRASSTTTTLKNMEVEKEL